MTLFLCKLFIKNHRNTKDVAVRKSYGTLCSAVGIILNVILSAVKFFAGVLTASVSVTADAVNNLSDAGSAVVSLVSFKMSAKPADRDHPFGHARIEYIASLIVSFVIFIVGLDLLKSSFEKIINPTQTKLSVVAIVILSLSIVTKLWIAHFNKKVSRLINSSVIRATSADSLSDALATAGVLVSMIISHYSGLILDGYVGLCVSGFIIFSGIKILNETKNSILGSPPEPEVVEDIHRIVGEYPEILGIHDMVVHNYGAGNTIASLHAEVDGRANVFDIHDVIDNIEKRLFDELAVRTTIHMDPIVTDDEEVTRLRAMTLEAVKRVDSRLSIHDFRVVMGKTHTNLIFDAAAPFDLKISNEDLKDCISSEISRVCPQFFTVITIDRQ